MPGQAIAPTRSLSPAQPSRGRGRPSKLSREQIIEGALSLLAEVQPEGFTLAKLAKKLGGATMSLYTYYPSRDALIEAVATHVFTLLDPIPIENDDWASGVTKWLFALQRLIVRYPIALKVISWEGRVSAAWMKAWLPIGKLLQEKGLEGPRLAITVNWFLSSALGLMYAKLGQTAPRAPGEIANIQDLDRDERRLAMAIWLESVDLDHNAVLALGYQALVAEMGRIIEERERAGE